MNDKLTGVLGIKIVVKWTTLTCNNCWWYSRSDHLTFQPLSTSVQLQAQLLSKFLKTMMALNSLPEPMMNH